jgi:hypothetical protein
MKVSGRGAKALLRPTLFILLGAAAVLGMAPVDRTLFKDIPPDDPARAVIQTVLGSTFYSMRREFTAKDWTGSGFAGAWERARRYFPGQTYLVRPGTYFMTHGFGADGRLFMEVHESAYLSLCVGNRMTFTPGSVVAAYGRMLALPDGGEAAAFREKIGWLEPFFRDEPGQRGLRKALGEALYRRLLEDLREEDYHMLAGGLMHEGMHAGLNDALVARLQADFGAGKSAVQWDELRAFMAEIGYHGAYGRWAEGDMADGWRQIERSLGDLERLRKNPRLNNGPDLARFERARADIWAYAALLRLRMREIWQSARRVQALAQSFREDYIKGAPPVDLETQLKDLERATAGFAAAAGEAIQASEIALRFLEDLLDEWSDWSAGRRSFPPPVTDSAAIIKQFKGVRWPEPALASAGAAALMKKATEALEKDRTSS